VLRELVLPLEQQRALQLVLQRAPQLGLLQVQQRALARWLLPVHAVRAQRVPLCLMAGV